MSSVNILLQQAQLSKTGHNGQLKELPQEWIPNIATKTLLFVNDITTTKQMQNQNECKSIYSF